MHLYPNWNPCGSFFDFQSRLAFRIHSETCALPMIMWLPCRWWTKNDISVFTIGNVYATRPWWKARNVKMSILKSSQNRQPKHPDIANSPNKRNCFVRPGCLMQFVASGALVTACKEIVPEKVLQIHFSYELIWLLSTCNTHTHTQQYSQQSVLGNFSLFAGDFKEREKEVEEKRCMNLLTPHWLTQFSP